MKGWSVSAIAEDSWETFVNYAAHVAAKPRGLSVCLRLAEYVCVE